jgi:hypothetical protein
LLGRPVTVEDSSNEARRRVGEFAPRRGLIAAGALAATGSVSEPRWC